MPLSDIFLFGISHETATLTLREKASLSEAVCAQGMGRLVCSDTIGEIVIYYTCSRLEFMLVSARPVFGVGGG